MSAVKSLEEVILILSMPMVFTMRITIQAQEIWRLLDGSFSSIRNFFRSCYAFDNFEKIELKGQETSEDISEILEDESRENCGYVVVPKGVELSDLDMEMQVDNGSKDEAVLTYTYEGSLVGSARAKVSEKYKKEHTANIKKQEKNSDKNSDNKEDTSGKKDLKQKLVIVFAAVLLLLVLVFIVRVIQYRKMIKRKRRRRRKQQNHRQDQQSQRREK